MGQPPRKYSKSHDIHFLGVEIRESLFDKWLKGGVSLAFFFLIYFFFLFYDYYNWLKMKEKTKKHPPKQKHPPPKKTKTKTNIRYNIL